ncbi:hypothetical protein [Natrinema sp. DC36]|uniref:hypothetical protein n=1 Tax=Natrinema sp. DC36 TaxID=2878680 RepID=UPI001CF033FA|nr:hypothetical protein [Natrinema sp. DC36]
MTYQNLNRKPTTARQRLVESSGTPFAPSAEVRPVVAVMDGRKRNDEIEPAHWRLALEAASVAVYFEIPADCEWWLAYDSEADERPFCRWTTYPSGGWDLTRVSADVLEYTIGEVEGHTHDIYRSRVVRIEDAPEFVRREVGRSE